MNNDDYLTLDLELIKFEDLVGIKYNKMKNLIQIFKKLNLMLKQTLI